MIFYNFSFQTEFMYVRHEVKLLASGIECALPIVHVSNAAGLTRLLSLRLSQRYFSDTATKPFVAVLRRVLWWKWA
jgi:hypothetical protein